MSDIDWDASMRRVNKLLKRDSMNGWHVVDGREVAWYGPFVTSLALALGDSEILCGDARLDENEDGSFTADVVLFTAKAFVVGRVTGERLATWDVQSEVRLYSRRELQFVGVRASGDAFSQDAFREWPGRIYLEVRYAPEVVIELPLRESSSSSELREELVALLDALRGEFA